MEQFPGGEVRYGGDTHVEWDFFQEFNDELVTALDELWKTQHEADGD